MSEKRYKLVHVYGVDSITDGLKPDGAFTIGIAVDRLNAQAEQIEQLQDEKRRLCESLRPFVDALGDFDLGRGIINVGPMISVDAWRNARKLLAEVEGKG